MRSKGSRFTLGVWGLRVCSLDDDRARPVWLCLRRFLQKGHFWWFQTSHRLVSRGRRGTLWFQYVSERVEGRFVWQAQYFCDVFRKCVPVFVAGAALWQPPSSFPVAGKRILLLGIARVPVCPCARGLVVCSGARVPGQGFSASRAENN